VKHGGGGGGGGEWGKGESREKRRRRVGAVCSETLNHNYLIRGLDKLGLR
jgi:hypothetical protein